MLVRWRRLVAFDLGFWTRTLVVGEDHAIAGAARTVRRSPRGRSLLWPIPSRSVKAAAKERHPASARIWHEA
jgi:hypothetical protein